MYNYFVQGLLLGMAYVAPIGMQNLYVINTAMRGNTLKTYYVASATIFFDITLALACFSGIGFLINTIPIFKTVLLALGAVAVIYIGIGLLRTPPDVPAESKIGESCIRIIVACFAVTWLNPQAILDGSLLLGAYHAAIPPDSAGFFIGGFCSASLLWFTGLTTVTLLFRNRFNTGIIRAINIICGCVLILFGVKFGISFAESLQM